MNIFVLYPVVKRTDIESETGGWATELVTPGSMGPILTAWDLSLKQMSGAADDGNVSKILAGFSFPNLQALFSTHLRFFFQVWTILDQPTMISSVFSRAKQLFHRGSTTRRGNWWVFWNSSVLWAPWCFWARCDPRRRCTMRPMVGWSVFLKPWGLPVDIHHKANPLHLLLMLIDDIDNSVDTVSFDWSCWSILIYFDWSW